MATGISSVKDNFKDEFLTCSICTELYDTDRHQAKCLPCLHTYCKACLEQLANGLPKLKCPNCRTLITFPDGGVDKLPNNFVVGNLREYHENLSLFKTCGSCDDESNQATSVCFDGGFLCQKCEDAHKRMKTLQTHKLSTSAELQEKKCNLKLDDKRKGAAVCGCGLIHKGRDLISLEESSDEDDNKVQHSSSSSGSDHQVTGRQVIPSRRKPNIDLSPSFLVIGSKGYCLQTEMSRVSSTQSSSSCFDTLIKDLNIGSRF